MQLTFCLPFKLLDRDADYMLDPDYMDLMSRRVIGVDVRAIAESPKSKAQGSKSINFCVERHDKLELIVDLARQHSVLSTQRFRGRTFSIRRSGISQMSATATKIKCEIAGDNSVATIAAT
jgi:hypothetical protein